MIFLNENHNFNDKKFKDNFLYDNSYDCTLKYYTEQYSYCIKSIINYGIEVNYWFNAAGRSIVSVFRHYIELLLKYNIQANKIKMARTHNLLELLKIFQVNALVVPEEIIELVNKISKYDISGNSSCWRYYIDKDGFPYFNFAATYSLNFKDFVETIRLANSTDSFDFICDFQLPNEITRRLEDRLIFILLEADSMGRVRASFNMLISVLLEGIFNKKISFNKIYLPLLFLIRHSIELGIKDILIEILEVEDIEIKIKLNEEHSLQKLFNSLNACLSKIEIDKLDPETQRQFHNYKYKFTSINRIIHDLDSDSLKFRYPIQDKKILNVLNNADFFNLFKVFVEIQPFLDFTVTVLKSEGALELSARDYGYYETMY